MTFPDRNKYLKYFRDYELSLPCPYCNTGVLQIKKESFHVEKTKVAKFLLDQVGTLEFDGFKFAAALTCKNCDDLTMMAGTASLVEYHHDECGSEECRTERQERLENGDVSWNDIAQGQHYHHHYEIKYIDPPINIIKLSSKVPEDIQKVLQESFSLFWLDAASAGNKIRVALELFMNFVGIAKEKGKERLTLKQRARAFGEIEGEKWKKLSDLLDAIRWLGNEAVHTGYLSREDVLDAYDVLEHVLDEYFHKEEKERTVKAKEDTLNTKFNKELTS